MQPKDCTPTLLNDHSDRTVLGVKPWFGVLIALATVGGSVLFREVLDPALGTHSPFITFFPAIALAVFFGRAGAGLLATFLSLLAANFFFVSPRFSFGTDSRTDVVMIAVFLLSSGVIIFLGEAMHRARDRAEYLRREAQAAEEAARELIETANEGIWLLDADARVTLVNPRLSELLGYSPAEIKGRFKWDFLFPEDIEQGKQLYERRRRGVSEQVDIRFRTKKGAEIWTVMAARARFDSQGCFIGALDMFTDISERKRLERELEKKVEERTARLQEIVQELEVFSYSIAHDLRAPLRAMQGVSRALLEDYEHLLPAQGGDFLRRIATSASLLDRQILNVLEYNHLLGGELPLDHIHLESLLQEILSSYPGLQEHRERIQVLDGIPTVLGNRAALRQVLANLLSNAVKFVHPGTPPKVRIWAESYGPVSRLCVQDNGIGISRKGQQKIFRLFQRLQTQDAYEGTGIGLAIVKKAVERMGGRVGVISESGHGSQFWIELNRVDEPNASHPNVSDLPAERPSPSSQPEDLVPRS